MATPQQIHGVDNRREINPEYIQRDVRRAGERFLSAIRDPTVCVVVGVTVIGLMAAVPFLMELWFLLGLLFYLISLPGTTTLPFRLPRSAFIPDPRQRKLKPSKPKERGETRTREAADGVLFLGNNRENGEELWFNASDAKTHALVIGSTGAGKTELLLSIAFNALVQGSGFVIVDGKADPALWGKVFALCRYVGREDDLLVINYIKGGADHFGEATEKTTNTMAPFAIGSAAGLTEMLVSMMDDGGSEGGMWKGRAIALISAIMKALVYKRNREGLLLTVSEVRKHLTLDEIQKMEKEFRGVNSMVHNALVGYLLSIPGYVEGAPKQTGTVKDQHGFLQMQFTKILGSLIDTYGHIFETVLGEVDLRDVVLRRRILLVMLPALENSPEELANLGKIIVTGLKQMMAGTMGSRLTGSYTEILGNRATTAASPMVVILDEYGYYVVRGASVMAAQARSLGFMIIYAGQDFPGFKKNHNEEEAVQTIGNCNIKIFMKVEDPTETYQLAQKAGGEAFTSKTSGFSSEQDQLVNGYHDNSGAVVERRSRIDLRDLQVQEYGQAHILFKSAVIRATSFWANPPQPKSMDFKLNHLLRVTPPNPDVMEAIKGDIDEMLQNLTDPHTKEDMDATTSPNLLLDSALAAFRSVDPKLKQTGPEAALAAIKSIAASIAHQGEAATKMSRDALADDRIDIFGGTRNPYLDDNEDEDDLDVEEEEDEDEGEHDHEGSPDRSDNEDLTWLDEQGHSSRSVDLKKEHGDRRHDHPLNSPEFRERGERSREEDPVFMDKRTVHKQIQDVNEAGGLPSAEAMHEADQMVEEMRRSSSYPEVTPQGREPDSILDIIDELDDRLEGGKQDDSRQGSSGEETGSHSE